ILIVDDSTDSREFCGLIVEMHNIKVRQAKDVSEAMTILDEGWKPDVVLVDLIMPGRHPSELIKRVKADKSLQATKIVVMSALPQVKNTAKKMGADNSVHKPFSMPNFVAALGLKNLTAVTA
ncbi:MAG: response regulator, partial [Bdellovibrionales bacterium]